MLKSFKTTDMKKAECRELRKKCNQCWSRTSRKHDSLLNTNVVLSDLWLQVDELVVHTEQLCMKQVHWLAQILIIYYINIELRNLVLSVSGNMDWSSWPIRVNTAFWFKWKTKMSEIKTNYENKNITLLPSPLSSHWCKKWKNSVPLNQLLLCGERTVRPTQLNRICKLLVNLNRPPCFPFKQTKKSFFGETKRQACIINEWIEKAKIT